MSKLPKDEIDTEMSKEERFVEKLCVEFHGYINEYCQEQGYTDSETIQYMIDVGPVEDFVQTYLIQEAIKHKQDNLQRRIDAMRLVESGAKWGNEGGKKRRAKNKYRDHYIRDFTLSCLKDNAKIKASDICDKVHPTLPDEGRKIIDRAPEGSFEKSEKIEILESFNKGDSTTYKKVLRAMKMWKRFCARYSDAT